MKGLNRSGQLEFITLDGFILHRFERSAMLSIQLEPADLRLLQRHYDGRTKRLAIVGQANVQPLKLRGLLKGKTDQYAPTHPVECVMREKWIV